MFSSLNLLQMVISIRGGLWIPAIGLVLLALGCGEGSSVIDDSNSPGVTNKVDMAVGQVELKIDLPKGDDISIEANCYADSTVFSIMRDAKESGLLEFESRGSADTLFLTSIAGVENSGAGKGNWSFKVNGDLGDKSSGVFEIKPDDKIEWSFGSVSFDE